ncbi:MAG: hypothetical protein O9262_04030, partial [Cyclobacteriaceae bacterium]|nr:hypothetical protein [Cyclobacteriaceae bacterium]
MKARLLTMVWLSVICTELYGQYSFASLEDLWKFAEGRNIQVHAAQTQHEIAKAGVRQARSNFLPGIGISGTFTDNITI